MMRIQTVDSHTGGEPTRVVLSGWPEPQGKTLVEKVEYMRKHHEKIRQGVVCEPRGHNAIVGALLLPAMEKDSLTSVIFFNDVGYIGMCGHAMLGLVETLRHLGRLKGNYARVDTPVGTVDVRIGDNGKVTVSNVPSYLYKGDVSVQVEGIGEIRGDIAWGGNWFFLVNNFCPDLKMSNIDYLMSSSKKIRQALIEQGFRGEEGAIVDHIEYFGPPQMANAHSKNFVLCPGNSYDRAPCGTGTSAKLACLHARGKLAVGEVWVQESITGSFYELYLQYDKGVLTPYITSRAYVTGESTLFFNEEDPFCWGIE